MKTYILSTSSILAAAAALAVASVSVVASGVALTAVGILAVFVEDYGRTIKPVSLPCETIRFTPAACALPELREAA
jgi:hypothetical protein